MGSGGHERPDISQSQMVGRSFAPHSFEIFFAGLMTASSTASHKMQESTGNNKHYYCYRNSAVEATYSTTTDACASRWHT